MPIVALNVRIENKKAITGMKGKWAGVMRESISSTAQAWMDKIFQSHFEPSSRYRYQHEPRSKKYRRMKVRRGVAGDTDLVLTGKSRRWLRAFARITNKSQRKCTLRMTAPTYFTNPPPGQRQPDKAAELTRMTDQDRLILKVHLESEIRRRVRELIGESG